MIEKDWNCTCCFIAKKTVGLLISVTALKIKVGNFFFEPFA